MFTFFKQASLPVKAVIVVVFVLAVWGAYSSCSNLISRTYSDYQMNKADQELVKKVNELEEQKKANIEKIAALEVEKQSEREKRVAIDVELKAIKDAIANDGKIVATEQQKINEAVERYRNEKDNCAAIDDASAYTKCVCAKLGVTCD